MDFCKSEKFDFFEKIFIIRELFSNFKTMDFKQAQELMKLQQQAQKIQEELSNTHIEAEVDGLVVTIDGQLKIVKTEIEDTSIVGDKERLEKAFTEAVNKGMKKAQEIAAERMRGVMSSMGINMPGL